MGIFLIIFGTRGVTYTATEGQFHCPDCGQQPYRKRRVRRFFTLYFIPVIPLDLLGEYVECNQCRGTYRPEILERSALMENVEAEFRVAIKRTMILMSLADGTIDDKEISMISSLYGKLAGAQLSEEEVRAEVAQVQQAGHTLTGYLHDVVGVLNDPGKELIVRAAFLVAAADGEFQDEEKQLLVEIGKALQMSGAHLNGVISSMLEDA
jgi:tellurite resistance protein